MGEKLSTLVAVGAEIVGIDRTAPDFVMPGSGGGNSSIGVPERQLAARVLESQPQIAGADEQAGDSRHGGDCVDVGDRLGSFDLHDEKCLTVGMFDVVFLAIHKLDYRCD